MTKIEDLTKRQVRYLCFRLQTEIEGGNKASKEAAGLMSFIDKIKEHMEEQDDFGGWSKFAKTWDVDEKSPLVVVKRTSSIYTDWNKILKGEAKELPVTQPKKVVQRGPGGRFVSKKAKTESVLLPPVSTDPPSPAASEGQSKKKFWEILK